MQAEGRVLEVHGTHAVVEVVPLSGCGRCHEPGGCGGGMLTQLGKPTVRRYTVLNSIAATPDDRVMLVIPEGVLWQASLWAYCLPLAGVMLGAGLATTLAASESSIVASSAIGLGLGVVGLKWRERQRTQDVQVRMEWPDNASPCFTEKEPLR